MANTRDAKALVRAINSLDNHIKQKRRQRAELFEMLQKRLKGGDGTGNAIRDFVIVHFGEIGGEWEKKLLDMSRLVDGHNGELLLVARYEESEGLVVKHASGHAKPKGIMGSVFWNVRHPTHLWLGQITEDGHLKVNVMDGTISLPIAEFALWTSDNNPIIRNSPGPNKEVFDLLLDMAHPFSLRAFSGMSTHHGEVTVELHIGIKEVLACLDREANGKMIFYKVARAVGYPEEKMPEDVLGYITAVKEDIRARLIKEDAAIQRILDSAERVRVRERTVLLSGQAPGELEGHRREISRLLVEAEELGMGSDPLVTELLRQPELMEEQTT